MKHLVLNLINLYFLYMLLCFCCSAITPTPTIHYIYINKKRLQLYRLENIHNLFSISLYIFKKKNLLEAHVRLVQSWLKVHLYIMYYKLQIIFFYNLFYLFITSILYNSRFINNNKNNTASQLVSPSLDNVTIFKMSN